MAMHDADHGDDLLDAYFSAGRSDPPLPDADFMARAVAEAEDAARKLGQAGTAAPPQKGFLDRFLARWVAPGGFVAASCLGLWIGYAGVGQLGSAANDLFAQTNGSVLELMPATDLFTISGVGGQ
ncbi:MAG: hypothetical protein KDE03_10435 [Rhodobacteraceae bacterium]|nr:hypothetical protein [Paracoccaceae bacterium]